MSQHSEKVILRRNIPRGTRLVFDFDVDDQNRPVLIVKATKKLAEPEPDLAPGK